MAAAPACAVHGGAAHEAARVRHMGRFGGGGAKPWICHVAPLLDGRQTLLWQQTRRFM